MIKKIFLYGSIVGTIISIITIYSLTVKMKEIKADRETMKQHYETQIEILKHPEEKKDEQKEKIRIVYKDKKGDPVIVEKEIIKRVIETRPVLLEKPGLTSQKVQRRFYVSGNYGQVLSDWEHTWGIGAGYNLTEWMSAGVRYDKGLGHNISIEMRINF